MEGCYGANHRAKLLLRSSDILRVYVLKENFTTDITSRAAVELNLYARPTELPMGFHRVSDVVEESLSQSSRFLGDRAWKVKLAFLRILVLLFHRTILSSAMYTIRESERRWPKKTSTSSAEQQLARMVR